jgi:tetratricopeptide (TPR) repeat protein
MLKKILTAAVMAGAMAGTWRATAAEPAVVTRADDDDDKIDELIEKARGLMKEKEYEDAAGVYKQVLKIDAKHQESLYQLSWIYNELKDYKQAEKYARQLIKANPKSSQGWRELGYAQMMTKRYDDAIESLEKALKLDPKDASSMQYVIAAHKAAGNDDEAAEWQKKLDAIEKKTPPKKKPAKPDDKD